MLVASTHAHKKTYICSILLAEDKCTSKQNDAIAGPATKTRAIRHRKTLVGEDAIDLSGVETLAVVDKDRGGTRKTMLAYINGMGAGLFSFVMLLTFISLCGWVGLFANVMNDQV